MFFVRSDWLLKKSEILGGLMASICSSRSVNVSKGGLRVKRFATPKFRDIDSISKVVTGLRDSHVRVLAVFRVLLSRVYL